MKKILSTMFLLTSVIALLSGIVSVDRGGTKSCHLLSKRRLIRNWTDTGFAVFSKKSLMGKASTALKPAGEQTAGCEMLINQKGSLLNKIYEDQFRIVDNRLMREERPFLDSVHLYTGSRRSPKSSTSDS